MSVFARLFDMRWSAKATNRLNVEKQLLRRIQDVYTVATVEKPIPQVSIVFTEKVPSIEPTCLHSIQVTV